MRTTIFILIILIVLSLCGTADVIHLGIWPGIGCAIAAFVLLIIGAAGKSQ